ncbi:MAG: nucleotidyltransferase family protein, partial [Stygiolobus sp.]|nr:nucleotidyltransferase family protein [Stygiolobus sp.]
RFFSDYDGVLVLLGDMPLISSETIKRIISAFKEGCSAVVPTYKGQRGNPVLISRKLFEKLKNLKGDIGARAILVEERNVCEVECGEEVIIDVDTPSDLASVRRLL